MEASEAGASSSSSSSSSTRVKSEKANASLLLRIRSNAFSLSLFLPSSLLFPLSLSPLLPMHWSTGLRETSPPTMARTSPALSWDIPVLGKREEFIFFSSSMEGKQRKGKSKKKVERDGEKASEFEEDC